MGIAVLSGCSSTVDGSAARADRTVVVRDLAEVLPTGAEVSRAAGNPLSDSAAPSVGGIDVLPNGIRDNAAANPIECLGPATPFMRVVYEAGDVRRAAWQEYANFGGGETVSSVDAGVVQFASDAEAERMFGAFVSQWKACEGKTVRSALPNPAGAELRQTVTDVKVDGPVLSATVVNSDNQGDASFPTERAIGLAADCVVDVDTAVTGGQRRPSGRAVDVVTTMRDKVTRGR
jgi:hypothetical protein